MSESKISQGEWLEHAYYRTDPESLGCDRRIPGGTSATHLSLLGPISFIFMQFSGQFDQIIGCRPQLWFWCRIANEMLCLLFISTEEENYTNDAELTTFSRRKSLNCIYCCKKYKRKKLILLTWNHCSCTYFSSHQLSALTL